VPPIRLAAVGCGSHASSSIHPSLIRVPEYDWVAACDLDAERLARCASLYNVRPYADLGVMIDQERPDAVLVIGPFSMHHDVGLAVLRRGCHLLVEKPPAMDAAGAKELVDAARAAGKMGAVCTHWRHSPAHVKLIDIVHAEAFGHPTFFEGRFHAPSPVNPGPYETTFMNYLFGQGVHLVDCTRAVMGDIAAVHAMGFEGDAGAIGLTVSVRFASGAVGTLAMASRAPMLDNYIEVFGDARQHVRVDNHDRLEMTCQPPWIGQGGYADLPRQTWSPGAVGYLSARTIAYIEEHRAYGRALAAGEQPRASLEDGYQACRVLEAIEQSRLTGETVEL